MTPTEPEDLYWRVPSPAEREAMRAQLRALYRDPNPSQAPSDAADADLLRAVRRVTLALRGLRPNDLSLEDRVALERLRQALLRLRPDYRVPDDA